MLVDVAGVMGVLDGCAMAMLPVIGAPVDCTAPEVWSFGKVFSGEEEEDMRTGSNEPEGIETDK